MENCVSLDNQIRSITTLISTIYQQPTYNSKELASPESLKKRLAEYRAEFEKNDCSKKISQLSQAETSKVISQFTNLDKARITEDTNYQLKQRVFFGGIVLVAGLVILTMFNKNK